MPKRYLNKMHSKCFQQQQQQQTAPQQQPQQGPNSMFNEMLNINNGFVDHQPPMMMDQSNVFQASITSPPAMLNNCLDFTGTGMLQNLQPNYPINDFFNTARLNQINQSNHSHHLQHYHQNQLNLHHPINTFNSGTRISHSSTNSSSSANHNQNHHNNKPNYIRDVIRSQTINLNHNQFNNQNSHNSMSQVQAQRCNMSNTSYHFQSSSTNSSSSSINNNSGNRLSSTNYTANQRGQPLKQINRCMVQPHQLQRHLPSPPPGLGYSASGCFNPIVDLAINNNQNSSSDCNLINHNNQITSPDVCNLNFGYRYNNLSFGHSASLDNFNGSINQNVVQANSTMLNQPLPPPPPSTSQPMLNPNANDFVPTSFSTNSTISNQPFGFTNQSPALSTASSTTTTTIATPTPTIFGSWNPTSMSFNDNSSNVYCRQSPSTSFNQFGSFSTGNGFQWSNFNQPSQQQQQSINSWQFPVQLQSPAQSTSALPPQQSVKPIQPPPSSINNNKVSNKLYNPGLLRCGRNFASEQFIFPTSINLSKIEIEKPRRSSSFTRNSAIDSGSVVSIFQDSNISSNGQSKLATTEISHKQLKSLIPSPIKCHDISSHQKSRRNLQDLNNLNIELNHNDYDDEEVDEKIVEFDQEDIFNISFWCNSFFDQQSPIRNFDKQLTDDNELTVEEIVDDQPEFALQEQEEQQHDSTKTLEEPPNYELDVKLEPNGDLSSSNDSSTLFNSSIVTAIERIAHSSLDSTNIDDQNDDILDLDKLSANLSLESDLLSAQPSLAVLPSVAPPKQSSSPIGCNLSASSSSSSFVLHNNSFTNNSVNAFNANASRFKDRLYKTEFCRNLNEFGRCKFADECRFAHSEAELRNAVRIRQVKYKTVPCCEFEKGICYYGARCWFIHQKPEPEAWIQQLKQMFADQFFDPNFKSTTGPLLEKVYKLVTDNNN